MTTPPAAPVYRVRKIALDQYVIDASWPSGSCEQLIGVFISRLHAQRWIENIFSVAD